MKTSPTKPSPKAGDSARQTRSTTEDAAAILSRRDFLIASALAGCGLAVVGSGCPASAPQKVKEPAVTDDTVYEDGPVEPVEEAESTQLGRPGKEERGEYDDLYPVELMSRAETALEAMRAQLAGHVEYYENATDDWIRECIAPNLDSMRQYLAECEKAYAALRRAAAQNDLDTARRRYGEFVVKHQEFSYHSSNADYCRYDEGQICLSEICLSDICLEPVICLDYEEPQICLR